MNLALIARTFVTIFVAELGDKTQLAALSLSTGGSRLSVFVGSSLALITSSAIAVLVGEGLSKLVPPVMLQRASGVLFLVLGIWTLIAAGKGE